MKNKNLRPLYYLVFCSLLFISSCGEGGSNLLPLNSVDIPEYTEDDYLKLLDHQNPEIVYSAICAMIKSSRNMGTTLSEDTVKDSTAFIRSQKFYDKVSGFLYSGNEWLVCSSLRFFSEFGSTYNKQDEIAEKLLKVDLKTTSIKLEFINALVVLIAVNPKTFESVLKKLISNESWLISRYAYKYLPSFRNYEFWDYLKSNYHGGAEYEKLLVLGCINDSCSDDVVDFLTSELKTEKNTKVKLFLAKNLEKAADGDRVTAWINENASTLQDIKEPVSEHYLSGYGDRNSMQITDCLFRNHLVSDSSVYGKESRLFSQLYGVLDLETRHEKDSASHGQLHYYESIENQLQNNAVYNKHWLAYKDGKQPFYSEAFLNAHQLLYEEYRRKTEKLFDDNGIDTTYKNNSLEEIEDVEKHLRWKQKSQL